MKQKLLTLVLSLVFSTAWATDNNCHDPEAIEFWEIMMEENGHYPAWQVVNAYRGKLCADIDKGEISLEEANRRFESLRQEKLDELRARLEKLEELLKRLEKIYGAHSSGIG